MADTPFIIGIGGTTRPGSATETALRFALAHCAARGAHTRLIGGAGLPREPYDPALKERSDEAKSLIEACRSADGIILATPAYHGGISGLVKNAIDFVEDLREDPRPYFDGRPVGSIVCAAGPQSMGGTLMALRTVVHALRGWPTPYAAMLNTSAAPFSPDGAPGDAATADALTLVANQVMDFVEMARR